MDVLVRTTPASAQTFGSFAKQKPSIIYFKKSPECYDALMELHDNDPGGLGHEAAAPDPTFAAFRQNG
jgi:hypothetical protein